MLLRKIYSDLKKYILAWILWYTISSFTRFFINLLFLVSKIIGIADHFSAALEAGLSRGSAVILECIPLLEVQWRTQCINLWIELLFNILVCLFSILLFSQEPFGFETHLCVLAGYTLGKTSFHESQKYTSYYKKVYFTSFRSLLFFFTSVVLLVLPSSLLVPK